MAEEKGLVGRFLSSLSKPFRRRSTPEPMMPLWKTGIQEPVLVQGVSIPALYATVQESIILRTTCLLYTSPSPRDATLSRMPSSA